MRLGWIIPSGESDFTRVRQIEDQVACDNNRLRIGTKPHAPALYTIPLYIPRLERQFGGELNVNVLFVFFLSVFRLYRVIGPAACALGICFLCASCIYYYCYGLNEGRPARGRNSSVSIIFYVIIWSVTTGRACYSHPFIVRVLILIEPYRGQATLTMSDHLVVPVTICHHFGVSCQLIIVAVWSC